ncbi:hypothetical protein D3C87_1800430 [compost metagenome]
MGDRSAKRGQPQAQEDEEHFQTGAPAAVRALVGGGPAGDVLVVGGRVRHRTGAISGGRGAGFPPLPMLIAGARGSFNPV